jgi:malate synthase
MSSFQTAPGVTITAKVPPACADVLSLQAQTFVATLHRVFNKTRKDLLQRRAQRQQQIDNGVMPDFLPETRAVREDPTWRGPKPAPGLVNRRVEITGPVDRKMVINALNCGATQFMADFEGGANQIFIINTVVRIFHPVPLLTSIIILIPRLQLTYLGK